MHMLKDHSDDMVLVFNVNGIIFNRIVIVRIDMPLSTVIDGRSYISNAEVTDVALAPTSEGTNIIFISCKIDNYLVVTRTSSSYSSPSGTVDFTIYLPARVVTGSKLLYMGSYFYSFAASTSFGPSSNSIAVFKFNSDITPVAES